MLAYDDGITYSLVINTTQPTKSMTRKNSSKTPGTLLRQQIKGEREKTSLGEVTKISHLIRAPASNEKWNLTESLEHNRS